MIKHKALSQDGKTQKEGEKPGTTWNKTERSYRAYYRGWTENKSAVAEADTHKFQPDKLTVMLPTCINH